MNFPNTVAIFKQEFYSSIDLIPKLGDLRITQFLSLLDKVSNTIIFNSIIAILSNTLRPETNYLDQKYAGLILEIYNPNPEIDLNEILQLTLENWDKSIAEFPHWIQKNYTITEIEFVCNILEKNALSTLERDKMQTVKWWLQL